LNIQVKEVKGQTWDLQFFDYRFDMHVTMMMDEGDMLTLLAQIPEQFHKENDKCRKIRGELDG